MPTPVGTGQITIIDIMDGISVRLSNSAHTVPTGADGLSGDFTGCASTVSIWLGQMDESTNWSASAVPSGGVTGSFAGKTYTVTGMSTNTGYVDFLVSRAGYSSLTARFTITKVKQGVAGATGPTVAVTANRATTFDAVDGSLVAGQADIVFTASVLNIAAPVYVWTFSGFQTAPTASTTSTQTITAAQFGTSTSATVTCTVNGTYVDKVTIVRLEKSTAAAGATVGATWGSNLSGQPSDSDLLNTQGNFQAERAWNFNGGLEGWTKLNAELTHTSSYAILDATSDDPTLESPAFSVYGPGFTKIRARIRRTAGSGWDGTVYYSTAARPGYDGNYRKEVVATVTSEWQVIEWDMTQLTSGGIEWVSNTITRIRLDLGTSAADTFEIDWIAIGSTAPGSYGAPSGSTVGDSPADAVSAATIAVNDSTSGLAQRLRANVRNVLGGAGGLAMGSLEWDSNGNRTVGYGVGLTKNGLAAFNPSGHNTFLLDGGTGAVTISGAASGQRCQITASGIQVFNQNGFAIISLGDF